MWEIVFCCSVVCVLVWEFDVHKEKDVYSNRDEEDFHYCVVEGDESEEEIHIASAEDNKVYFLGFGTYASAFCVTSNFVYDDYKRKQMKKIANKLKYIYHFSVINTFL